MARRGKLRGAAKAAFLRRMARGRRRAGIKTKPSRRRRAKANPAPRKRKRTVRRARAKRSIVSRVASLPISLVSALLKGRGRSMAKRRRKSSSKRRRRRNPGALLVNPSRRRRRRRARANPRRRRRRNPSRYTRRTHRRRRRNPGMMSMVRGGGKALMLAAIPATIGGFTLGFIDSKFFGTAGTLVRTGLKLGLAALAGTVGKRWLGPMGSGVAMGAILGSIGTEFGVKAAGGMVAMTKAEGVSELLNGAAYDAETQQVLGELLNEGDLEGDVADKYQNALTGTPVDPYSQALGEDSYGEADAY